MAYSFNGTSQYISGGSAPVSVTPLTMAAFVRREDGNVNTFVCVENADNSDGFKQGFFSNTVFGMAISANNGAFSQSPASSFPLSTTIHAATVFVSSTSRTTYADGASGSVNAASRTPGTLDRFKIAAQGSTGGSVGGFWNGLVSEVALWSVALTAAEVVSLSKGFRPYRVRPQSLVLYAPLVRNLQDLSRAITLTNNNSATVANHPRVY